MSDVDANIRVNIETAQAQAQLRALQTQIATLQKTMARTSMSQMGLSGQGIAAAMPQLKGFNNEIVTMASNTKLLDKSLAGASRGVADSFKTVRQSITKTGTAYDLAIEKAQVLNRQYTQVGKSIDGVSTVIRSTPLNQMATNAQVTAQRLTIMNRALTQGGTAILNWGKNMQWAGRQLMVGFTIPLTIAAGLAAKAFMDLEREVINFQRVYGDFDTSIAETERMTQEVQNLAIEMSKLGFTAKETIGLAADAAATGLVGEELINVTEQATKLATLGMISQEQALTTMISLNSAFKISGKELENTVNFLNAVENQTVLALSDVTEAIPLVAPVIQGLGGDIQDLSVMLTAMREGGIGANEAANALKTSLARLVTPAKAARDRAEELGINLKALVEDNQGDLMGMITDLGRAMESLTDLQKQQLLSDLFGKRQFARMGALFSNITDEASQAQRVIDLTAESTQNLANLADKELGAIEQSATMQFKSAIEQLKVAIAPIGEDILRLITPVIEFGTRVANWFNDLGDNAKNALKIIAIGVGAAIPLFIQFVGLVGNFTGMIIKGAAALLKISPLMRRLGADANYLGMEQQEAALAAAQLEGQEASLTGTLNAQSAVVQTLAQRYNALAVAMRKVPATAGGQPGPMKFATGGTVPGAGNTDRVPAMLTPGEFVVKKSQADKHRGFLSALNSGSVKGYAQGGSVLSVGNKQVPLGVDFGEAQLNKLSQMVAKALEWGVSEADIESIIATSVEQGTQQGLSSGGEMLGQIKDDLQTEFGGEGLTARSKYSKDGSLAIEKSHVTDPRRMDTKEVQAYADSITDGTSVHKELIDTVGANNVVMEQLSDTVLDLPSAVNQSTKAGGSMSGKAAKTALLDPDVAPQTFDTMRGQFDEYAQMNGLSQAEIAEGYAQIDAAQDKWLQQVAEMEDGARVVESATGELGENMVSLNDMFDSSTAEFDGTMDQFLKEIKQGGKNVRISLTEEGKRIAKERGMMGRGDGKVVGSSGKSMELRRTTSARGDVEGSRSSSSKSRLSYDKKHAEKVGKGDAKAYNKGVKSVLKDPYPNSRQRKSPHPLAAKDGADDGKAYSQARKAAMGKGLAGSNNPANNALAQLQNQTTKQDVDATKRKVATTQAVAASQQKLAAETKKASVATSRLAMMSKRAGAALQKYSGKLTMGLGALAGATTALSMFDNQFSQMAQQAMPIVFGLMGLQQILPMLANPWVALIAAVAAIGGTFYMLHRTSEGMLKAQRDYVKAIYGSVDDLKKFEDATGVKGNLSKEIDRRMQEANVRIEEKDYGEAANFIATDFGKELTQSIKDTWNKSGTDAAANALATRLTRAVLDGSLSPQMAQAIAAAVGTELQNTNIAVEASGRITDLIGPDGIKLDGNRMTIYADIKAEIKNMDEAFNQAAEDYDSRGFWDKTGLFASGKRESDLVASAAGARYGESQQIAAEAMASLNQQLVDGTISADEFDTALKTLYADTGTAANYLESLRLETEKIFGPDSFDSSEAHAFVSALEASAVDAIGVGQGMGKDFAQKFVDSAEQEFKATKGSGFGNTVAGMAESGMVNVDLGNQDSIKKMQAAYQEIIDLGGDDAVKAQDELNRLNAAVEDHINLMGQLQSGDFKLLQDESYDAAITRMKVLSNEGEKVKWLMTEIDPDSALGLLLFPQDERGVPIVSDKDMDLMAEIQILAMQAGVSFEGMYDTLRVGSKTSSQAIIGVKKVLEAYNEFGETEFENKEAEVKFVMEKFGWDEDVISRYEGLSDGQRKDFVLNYVLALSDPQGLKDWARNFMTGSSAAAGIMNAPGGAEFLASARALSQIPTADGDNPADTPTGSSGSSGGGKESDWLKDLEKETEESKKLYGKIIKAEKGKNKLKQGWVDWLRKNSELSEAAIQELAKDEKAREKYFNASGKKQDKWDNMESRNMVRSTKNDIAGKERANATKQLVVNNNELNEAEKQTILNNDKLLHLYERGGKWRKKAIDLAGDLADAEMTVSEQLALQNNALKQQQQYYLNQIKVSKLLTEQEIERNALGGDRTLNDIAVEQNVLNKEAAYIRASQIAPLEQQIDAQEEIIDGYEREIDKIQDVIDGYQDQVDAKERTLEIMSREDELRMRESDMLSHDLTLMGQLEEQVNKVYNDRIEALQKVQNINQQIAQSQQDQLGLADALTRGDIGAAAKAAQQMQANQANFASQAFQSSLETARDSAVASITGPESGMTREQIDARQRELEEQSYQHKLKMRVIEDEIYDLRQLQYGQEVLIEAQTALIETAESNIVGYQDQIADIEKGRLAEIEKITLENQKQQAFAEWQIAAGTAEHDKAIGRAEAEFEAINAINDLEVEGLKLKEEQGAVIKQNLDLMNKFGKAAARAYQAVRNGTYTPVEYSKKLRKKSAELQKQMEAISFDAKTYVGGGSNTRTASYNVSATGSPVSSGTMAGVAGSVTNNFMNNNVSVNAASANANEVADIVYRRLELDRLKNVGG